MALLTDEVREYVRRSVLCWLATVNDGQPSVSPKEMFTDLGEDRILIANIASPQSVANIQSHRSVCVSFIDVFAQRGFQLYGEADVLSDGSSGYREKREILQAMAGDKLDIVSVIEVRVDEVRQIIAPSYFLREGVTETQMIQEALVTYGVSRPSG